MKIGLIFPNNDRKDKTVHIGLGYIAAYARIKHHDLEFTILDTRIASKKESKDFYRKNFDLIGITVLSPVYHEAVETFHTIKRSNPNIRICLGGPYVTTMMEEIFEEMPVDFAVYGEGEITFSELLFHLKSQKRIEDIDGLMYKTGDNTVVKNPPRIQIEELDSIPFPAYDLFRMDAYPMHRITTSRGCPYKCVFCNSSSIWDWKWRKRGVENIIDEIQFLLKNYRKKVFFFNDNTFNVDLERVELFCNKIIENKIKFLWSTPVKVERITESVAGLMKKAGCYSVGIGIESANSKILKNIKKSTTIEQITEGINIFKKAGIEVLGQFVIGSPGDTLETVKESIDFAKKSNLDFVMFYSVLPFKGTEQWDYVLESGNFPKRKIHDFHSIKPQIIFDTPEFSYGERLQAIDLAKNEGYYSDSNDRSWLFDLGKEVTKRAQQYLPHWFSNKMYMFMKNIYRKQILNT